MLYMHDNHHEPIRNQWYTTFLSGSLGVHSIIGYYAAGASTLARCPIVPK